MINCIITSPAKTDKYKDVLSVMLPAFSGRMQILSGHAEAFVSLKKGNILLQQLGKQSKNTQIPGGECHIKDNTVVIIL